MSICDEACRYFKTRNLYDVLDVLPDVMNRDIRTSAYMLLLQEHPELQTQENRKDAENKCMVIFRIMRILTDETQRTLYNQRGVCDDQSDSDSSDLKIAFATLLAQLAALIKTPVGLANASDNFQQYYRDSALERADIVAAYKLGRGCMDRLIVELPLMTIHDEPRVKRVIKDMIKKKDLVSYVKFNKETGQKRRLRHIKFKMLGGNDREPESEIKPAEQEKPVEQEPPSKKKGRPKKQPQEQPQEQLQLQQSRDTVWLRYANQQLCQNIEDDEDLASFAETQPAESTDVLMSNSGGCYSSLMAGLTLKYGQDDEVDFDGSTEQPQYYLSQSSDRKSKRS